MSLIGKVAQLELENTFTNKNIFNEEVIFDKSDGPPFSISNSTVIPGLNADMVDGLEGSAITGRLDDVENQIANIDVSWSGVTGKPSTFPPSTHTHTTSQLTDFASHTHTTAQITNFSSHTHTSSQVGLGSVQNYGIATQAECDAASINNKYVTPLGLANLKQSVVNGKQAVVNAINGVLGYVSGLTTNNTHDDYSWWIANIIPDNIKRKIMYSLFSTHYCYNTTTRAMQADYFNGTVLLTMSATGVNYPYIFTQTGYYVLVMENNFESFTVEYGSARIDHITPLLNAKGTSMIQVTSVPCRVVFRCDGFYTRLYATPFTNL